MEKFLQASLVYRNSMIYPETGRTITKTIMGRHLKGSHPAIRDFYQLKKEFVMEREE